MEWYHYEIIGSYILLVFLLYGILKFLIKKTIEEKRRIDLPYYTLKDELLIIFLSVIVVLGFIVIVCILGDRSYIGFCFRMPRELRAKKNC